MSGFWVSNSSLGQPSCLLLHNNIVQNMFTSRKLYYITDFNAPVIPKGFHPKPEGEKNIYYQTHTALKFEKSAICQNFIHQMAEIQEVFFKSKKILTKQFKWGMQDKFSKIFLSFKALNCRTIFPVIRTICSIHFLPMSL